MEALEAVLKFSQVSAPALLVFAVWCFATGRVVPRWLYDREVARTEALQRLLEREKAFNGRQQEQRLPASSEGGGP